TTSKRDWSSDVCSSDLGTDVAAAQAFGVLFQTARPHLVEWFALVGEHGEHLGDAIGIDHRAHTDLVSNIHRECDRHVVAEDPQREVPPAGTPDLSRLDVFDSCWTMLGVDDHFALSHLQLLPFPAPHPW